MIQRDHQPATVRAMRMSDRGGPRYAVYFAPSPGSALHALGRAWLGRDADTGEVLPGPAIRGMDLATWMRLTFEPRRYGFHATLKAPFRLAESSRVADVVAALGVVGQTTEPFALPPLRVCRLGAYVAFTLDSPLPRISALAARCVRELDAFRAPATAEELARRGQAGLTERQRVFLERWGYPHVLDEWQFHMTLAGPVRAERARVLQTLTAMADEACREPVWIRDLCLFAQPAPDMPFKVAARVPLGMHADA